MYIYIINHNYIYIFRVLFRYKIIGFSPKGWVSLPLVGMVDSVQMPVFMALLLSPCEPLLLHSFLRGSNPTNRPGWWAVRRWEGLEEQQYLETREFAFCQLPFGHKSLFSSGKFSAVECEGLNAIGFWWKTEQKGRNRVLSVSLHLWLNRVS